MASAMSIALPLVPPQQADASPPSSPRSLHYRGDQRMLEMIAHNQTAPTLDLSYRCNRQFGIATCGYRPRLYGPAGAQGFADSLIHNTTLTELRFENSELGAQGCLAIATALTVNTQLRILNLNDNITDAEGSRAVACKLASSTHLQQLHFQKNALDAWGLMEMSQELKSNPYLGILDLSFNLNLASDQGLAIAHLVNNCEHLVSLNLMGTGVGSACEAEMSEAFKKSPKLRVLKIGEEDFSSASGARLLEAIGSNERLCSLTFSGSKVSSTGLSQLMRGLSQNPCLNCLFLERIYRLDGEMIEECLLGFNQLKCLKLAQLRMNIFHMKEIAMAVCHLLRSNAIIYSLSIDKAMFSVDETQMLAALEGNYSLTRFRLTEGMEIRSPKIDAILIRNAHNERCKRESLFTLLHRTLILLDLEQAEVP